MSSHSVSFIKALWKTVLTVKVSDLLYSRIQHKVVIKLSSSLHALLKHSGDSHIITNEYDGHQKCTKNVSETLTCKVINCFQNELCGLLALRTQLMDQRTNSAVYVKLSAK